MVLKKYTILLSVLFVLGFSSCDDDEDVSTGLELVTQSEVVGNYADLVLSNYEASLADAQALEISLNNFAADPTAMKLQLAKNAWLAARESYGPTEAYRFAEGPIDVIGTDEGPEGLLNSWPLDEAYIDYVEGAPNSGIINDVTGFPTIDKATLVGLNGDGGEENVSVGYHAIEFLLWGQDLTEPSELQAGKRLFTDFVDGGTAENQSRRRDYLLVCADLLTDHLEILVDQWSVNGPYRTEFINLDEHTALSNIMTAIATLSKSELAGERVFTAYDNRDQEDEHSCFADNTHRDLRLNFDGIRDVYLGRNGALEGASLHDLIQQENPTLAQQIMIQLDVAQSAVYGTAIPFDFAISDESTRPGVLAAVTALRNLGDQLVEGGNAIDVDVRTDG